jgi:hypothetical protein
MIMGVIAGQLEAAMIKFADLERTSNHTPLAPAVRHTLEY